MTFHTIRDISPPRSGELVCRQSKVMNWVPVVSLAVAMAGIALIPADGSVFHWVRWGVELMLLLILMAFFASLRKSYGPENWLLRLFPRGDSIWIKFRSYQNEHFSDDDPVILKLIPQEVTWVGLVKEHWLRPSDDRGTTSEHCTYLDIGLAEQVDIEPLRQKLDEERHRQPPGHYVKTTYRDFPVKLLDGSVIRLVWRSSSSFIVPSPGRVIREMSRFAEVREPRQKFLDAATPAADQKAMEGQIIELIERGDVIGATKLVRRRYRCSLTEARKFVEELTAPSTAVPSPGTPGDGRDFTSE
jgi:hypothetical protein